MKFAQKYLLTSEPWLYFVIGLPVCITLCIVSAYSFSHKCLRTVELIEQICQEMHKIPYDGNQAVAEIVEAEK